VNDSGNDGPNVVMEMSAAGRSAYGGNASNQVIWAWVNAPGLDQPVERIAFINGEARNRQVFHTDGLGSIAALTDESGATIQTYAYEAFGSIRTQTGTDLNRITYTAREAMGDSLGFFYYRHRIYDPHTGRFTSEDPLGFVDGVNLYIYVGNNPLLFVDPTGCYWFRQDWQEPGVVGREKTIVPPGGLNSEFIEQHVPAGYTFGQLHDAFVGAAVKIGFPFKLVNIPSMIPAYRVARYVEVLRTLRIIKQPSPPEKATPCQ
jgi:RHS repeat-associated protein